MFTDGGAQYFQRGLLFYETEQVQSPVQESIAGYILCKPVVLARPGDDFVEKVVIIRPLEEPFPPVQAGLDYGGMGNYDFLQLLGGYIGGGPAGGFPLQEDPHLKDLVDIGWGQATDDWPSVVLMFDEAVLGQLEDGVVDGGSADPKLFGQGQFADRFTWFPFPGDDLLQDLFVDGIGEWLGLGIPVMGIGHGGLRGI